MNILIFNQNNSFTLCIPAHSIAYFEQVDNAIKLCCPDNHRYCMNSRNLYVIGNSARKLTHALVAGADRVQLCQSEFFNERHYQTWQQGQVNAEVSGLLPAATLVRVG